MKSLKDAKTANSQKKGDMISSRVNPQECPQYTAMPCSQHITAMALEWDV